MEENTRTILLYDYYGELLSKRQQEVMDLYYDDNLSLAEIGEEFGISRQGVHDALQNAKRALEEYESKLGLVRRFEGLGDKISKIEEKLDELNREPQDEEKVKSIKALIYELGEA